MLQTDFFHKLDLPTYYQATQFFFFDMIETLMRLEYIKEQERDKLDEILYD